MGPYLLRGLEGVGFRAVLGFGAFGFSSFCGLLDFRASRCLTPL